MARYTGPVCRLCRREGVKLFLKGDRCYSGKCAMEKRSYAPGQHGQRRSKQSEYGMQLREKQKARRIYGVLEGQFETYFDEAERKKGVTGENLLSLLERRLDNVVYRMGMAESRRDARQLVLHGHFRLNGKKVTVPSISVKVGDVISLREESKASPKFKELIEKMQATKVTPKWLECNSENITAKVVAIPEKSDIDYEFEEQLIVELYSK